MPYDEQFNETKTFGFVGDELRAGITQVCSYMLVHLTSFPGWTLWLDP